MSGEFAQGMDLLSKFATVAAFGAIIATFVILYKRTRKSEEYRIANDISKSLTESELKILEAPSDDAQKRILRHKQYLNVWEWFALLVNNHELKNENVLEHFKPLFLSDYKRYSDSEMFPELIDNSIDDFRQIRDLYAKWKGK
ncbi:MAG TPA: hypothetical protein VKA87_04125 [Nitrososphaeraceae archaeon]|nr:hypothetical protein [Nitrososphaeraceae archaeon]